MEELLRENERLKRQHEEDARQHEKDARQHEENARQIASLNRRREEDARQLDGLFLPDYLHACHRYLHIPLAVQPNSTWCTKGQTSPRNKYYPKQLAPWKDFLQLHQTVFASAKASLSSLDGKDPARFHNLNVIQSQGRDFGQKPIANEMSLRYYEHTAIELHIEKIIEQLSHDRQAAKEFALGDGIDFENDANSLSVNDRELQDRLQPMPHTLSSRLASALTSDLETTPSGLADQYCVYKKEGKERHLLYVVEYKPPHKLTTDILRHGFRKMDLAQDVFGRADIPPRVEDSYPKTRSGEPRPAKKARVWAPSLEKPDPRFLYDADQMVAAVATQTFHYMIESRLPYSYITTGQGIVFLHVRYDDPTTLYYHVCIPDQTDPNIPIEETALARILGLTLIAFKDRQPRPHAWLSSAKSLLTKHSMNSFENVLFQTIPASAEKATPHSEFKSKGKCTVTSNYYLRSRRDGPDDEDDSPTKRKGPSSGSGTQKKGERQTLGNKTTSGAPTSKHGQQQQQQRQYCTQKCLLGLTTGTPLDPCCPNVEAHRPKPVTVYRDRPSQQHHAITKADFPKLVRAQLARNLDVDCKPMGIQGARGLLFRITLSSHGYCFVAKGTVYGYIEDLLYEGQVYQHLEQLQGKAIPVYLGNIDLARKYHVRADILIRHMLLLSWAGELSGFTDRPPYDDIAKKIRREAFRTLREVQNAGVDQEDFRAPNLLWNEELKRVMLIDFERAVIYDDSSEEEETKASEVEISEKCADVINREAADVVSDSRRILQESSPNKKLEHMKDIAGDQVDLMEKRQLVQQEEIAPKRARIV
ncbi:MAG: hypothetical protein Q9184_004585 [Pyrenodesmia sp. 2 TL-2023]